MFSRLASALLVLATCANATLNFNGASWIWSTNAVSGAAISLPTQSRAFRKDILTGTSKLPTSIEVIITSDDAYTLYVNGASIGSGNDWTTPQYYCIRANPVISETVYGQRVAVAVTATNVQANTPAGLLAAVKINYLNGASEQFVTDRSWGTSLTVPAGYQDTNFNTSTWAPAVVEGTFGVGPWGFVAAPGVQSC